MCVRSGVEKHLTQIMVTSEFVMTTKPILLFIKKKLVHPKLYIEKKQPSSKELSVTIKRHDSFK